MHLEEYALVVLFSSLSFDCSGISQHFLPAHHLHPSENLVGQTGSKVAKSYQSCRAEESKLGTLEKLNVGQRLEDRRPRE